MLSFIRIASRSSNNLSNSNSTSSIMPTRPSFNQNLYISITCRLSFPSLLYTRERSRAVGTSSMMLLKWLIRILWVNIARCRRKSETATYSMSWSWSIPWHCLQLWGARRLISQSLQLTEVPFKKRSMLNPVGFEQDLSQIDFQEEEERRKELENIDADNSRQSLTA